MTIRFGAVRQGTVTLFRLFSPLGKDIFLEIENRPPIAMQRAEAGFLEAAAEAPAGTRYRYRMLEQRFPDPASRRQSGGVHGWSVVMEPSSYKWRQNRWKGRPWEHCAIYEIHPGLSGGFEAVAQRLLALRALGFTAIELMPIAAFPGKRNWGYDGVLPFAPAEAYGTPDELKALIDRAHELELMVFLDVVYNHFGPEGNYLPLYAPEFFREDVHTPWGAAIDFRDPTVRRFFAENAIYWISEFRFDGLRFDAVHAIEPSDWLIDLAREVHTKIPRQIHLVVENDANDSLLLEVVDAQWNDDFHHVLHVLLTGEREGYYADHASKPAARLARVLSEGFDYQGQFSGHRQKVRGSPSRHLAPTSFVAFLQNHDQVGNRASGDRLSTLANPQALAAAVALLLLAPSIPLVFDGEDIGSESPFLFFTDHPPQLAQAVREGRAREFGFQSEAQIPDPNAEATFEASRAEARSPHADAWSRLYRDLLGLRARLIVPRLKGAKSLGAKPIGPAATIAHWLMSDGLVLTIAANFAAEGLRTTDLPKGMPIWGETDGCVLGAHLTVAWLEPT